MFACGLIAGRFMSLFLELKGAKVPDLSAENGTAVAVAEPRPAALGRDTRSLPGEPRNSSLLGQNPLTGTKPHHTCLPTNPPNTSGHKRPSWAKPPRSSPSTRSTSHCAGTPLAPVSKTSLRGVGALLHACPLSFILPAL